MIPGKTIGAWSLGLVGGGGTVATGGSLIFTSAYPTGDAQLTREGLSWSPMKPRMGTDIGAEIASSSNFGSYNCFKTFFPGADVRTDFIKEGDQEKETEIDPLKDVSAPAIGSEENKPSPVGCALIGFSYKNPSGNEQLDFALKTEVVFKNDNFGWALWGGLYKRSTSSSQDLKYRLIFLKKDEGTDRWSVMGGYMWSDYEFSLGGKAEDKLHILVPGDSRDWGDLIRSTSGSVDQSYEEYSGFWNVSEEGSEEMFRGIKIYEGNSESSIEILGKKDGEFEDASDGTYGFQSAIYSYDKDRKGWLRFAKQPNIRDILNKLYKPFIGKKGKWENMQQYCSYNRYGRFLGKEDMEKLKQFCYTEKAKDQGE